MTCDLAISGGSEDFTIYIYSYVSVPRMCGSALFDLLLNPPNFHISSNSGVAAAGQDCDWQSHPAHLEVPFSAAFEGT